MSRHNYNSRQTHFTYHPVTGYLIETAAGWGSEEEMVSRNLDFDARGRVLERLEDGNNSQLIYKYEYDLAGNVISIDLPQFDGDTHYFDYDLLGLQSGYNAPLLYGLEGVEIPVRTEYYWDDDKRPLRVEYPDGGDVSYSYNPVTGKIDYLNYEQCESQTGSEDNICNVERTVEYVYEGSGAKRLSSVSSETDSGIETISYSYNGMLPLSETMSGTVNGSIEYSHNGFFELTGMKINNLEEVEYTYDKDGLLTKAGKLSLSRSPLDGSVDTVGVKSIWTKHYYEENGEIRRVDSGNDLYTYNIDEKDALGRIVQKTEYVRGEKQTYRYIYGGDGHIRKGTLVGVTVDYGNNNFVYTLQAGYDENGNRTVFITPSGMRIDATYDPQDRLITFGDYRYDYTEAGALSKKKDNNHTVFNQSDDLITTYNYDQGGNLLNVNLPNGTEIEYTVDATNRRIAKKVNGEFEYKLLYSGQLSPACGSKSCTEIPMARLDEKDNVVEQYVYATRVNVPDYMVKGGSYYRLLTDHRGSVRMVVNASTGEIVQETEYSEFGSITDETLAQGWEPVIFGYAGGLQDRHTGLIRFGARDYDPETGRWTSKEPLGFNGSSNFYAYADNDPVNKVDPSGKIAIFPFLGVVAAGAAVNVWINYDSSKSLSAQAGDLAVKAVIGGTAAGAGFFTWWASIPTAATIGVFADLTNQVVSKKDSIDWRSVGISGATAASGAIVGNALGGICKSEAVGAFASVGATGILDYNRDSALGWSGDQFNNLINWAKGVMSPVIQKSQNPEYMEGGQ